MAAADLPPYVSRDHCEHLLRESVTGKITDVYVYDSQRPSIWAVNQQLADAHRKKQRTSPSSTPTGECAFLPSDTANRSASEIKSKLSESWKDQIRHKEEQQRARRELDLQQARRILTEAKEAEQTSRNKQSDMKRAQRIELQRAAEEAIARRRSERQRSSSAGGDRQGVDGLALASPKGPSGARPTTAGEKRELQEYWQHQIHERHERSEAERRASRTAATDSNASILGQIGEARSSSRRGENLAELKHELDVSRQAREQRVQEERQRDAAVLSFATRFGADAKRQENRSVEAKKDLLEELKLAAEKAHRARSTVRVAAVLDVPHDQEILFRCPVTRRAYPPRDFV